MGDWYDKSGAPSNRAALTSSVIRAEFALIDTAMTNLPTYTGNASKLIAVNSGASALEAITALTGIVTSTVQPCFLARNTGVDTGVTGNGAVFTVDYNSESFDQGNDFSSDTFTAPITGRYLFSVSVKTDGMTAAADTIEIILVTSNFNFRKFFNSSNDIKMLDVLGIAVIADMDASDTAHVTIEVNGEVNDTVVDVGTNGTYFSGCLLVA